jgi:hypothetical protein
MRKTLPRLYPIIITALCSAAVDAAQPRFVPLNNQATPISTAERARLQEWPCVLDQRTGLLWEGKSRTPGLHHYNNTYNWFSTDHARNGGLAGEPGGQFCGKSARQPDCDTQRFIQAVNREGLCQAKDWRLPHREELRSLVDYRIPYPGPTIDRQAFPNHVAQFYWSVDPKASEPLEAWGVGFAFGFDYAYFKNNRVHVRLVSDSVSLATNQ